MGFGKARATANRHGERRRAKVAVRPDSPADERAPDLWDVPGATYPGSPKGGEATRSASSWSMSVANASSSL